MLAGAQSSVKVDLSGIAVSEKTISQDGQTVKITIVKPAGATGKLPAFMFFQGSGWVLGDFPTHQRMVRDLVVESGAVAVFVNYTPSPEAHYPVAINQAYATNNFDTPSYTQFGTGRFLTTNMMKWFWDNYTTNPAERANIYASPLRATT